MKLYKRDDTNHADYYYLASEVDSRITELEAQLEAAKKDSGLLDFLEEQQDVSYQDHTAHWIGVDGGNIRYFLEQQKLKRDAAIQAKEKV